MPHFIDVILPIPILKTFTYQITSAEATFIKSGMRVAVPFGKSKVYTAIVQRIHTKDPLVYKAKAIYQILDKTPIVTPTQLQLWKWIADYYLCALGDVMRAALPSGFLLESTTTIKRNKAVNIDENKLNNDEFLVFEALQHKSSLKIKDIEAILDKKQVYPIIKQLLDKNIICTEEIIYEKYAPKLIRYVKLSKAYNSEDSLQALLDDLSRSPKQTAVILNLFSLSAKTKKPIAVTQLSEQSNSAVAIIKTLIDKGVLEEYYLQTDRVKYHGKDTVSSKTLNSYQEEALSEIKHSFKTHSVVLLHGVTASGKTELYVKLIEAVIKTRKQVLYLLPEIALTTQLVTRLQNYFGEKVAVYHSKYSVNERIEVWQNVLQNTSKAQVIIGVRSAVFLPFQSLGLVIVDEEHEQSYKQFDPAPRYHGRDVAIVLANLYGIKTLLGSATPSLESFYNAKQNKYGLVTLLHRYNNVLLPKIELIDLKDKHKRKQITGHFSDTLQTEMDTVLQAGQQVILFQNRRGFSPIVECQTCGFSPQCPNCDVSLTFHQFKNQLRCHYCGYYTAMLQQCMACGNVNIDTKGFGTEQLEQEVGQLFPNYSVGRMDLDTTRGKYGYEKIINAFQQRTLDILVGTQMLTKGLDFRNVALVGIMHADNILNIPDFRAYERGFQLMVQVSGRAGRTERRGKVLLQTYNPKHPIFKSIVENDYLAMYNSQIGERKAFKYPPFYRIIKITFKHKNFNQVNLGAEWFAKSLQHYFKDNVLGPSDPPVSRIKNLYYKDILLKIPANQSLNNTKKAVVKINNSFESVKDFRSVKVVINVDNY